MIDIRTRKLGVIEQLRARVAAVVSRPSPAFRLSDLRVIAMALARNGVVPAEHIRADMRLGDHLALDGLDRIEIAIDLEERLAIVGHLDTAAWVTVGDVIASVAAAPRNEL